jgi:hypothetical protein
MRVKITTLRLAAGLALAVAVGPAEAAEPTGSAGAPVRVHAALARHYRAEAEAARVEQARRVRMAEANAQRPTSQRWIEERRRNERLAERAAERAREYEALASDHEKRAGGSARGADPAESPASGSP